MRLRICFTLVTVLMTGALATAQENPPAKNSKAKADQRPFNELADAKTIL